MKLLICFLCALAYMIYSEKNESELGYTDVAQNLAENSIVTVFIIQFGSWVLLLT